MIDSQLLNDASLRAHRSRGRVCKGNHRPFVDTVWLARLAYRKRLPS